MGTHLELVCVNAVECCRQLWCVHPQPLDADLHLSVLGGAGCRGKGGGQVVKSTCTHTNRSNKTCTQHAAACGTSADSRIATVTAVNSDNQQRQTVTTVSTAASTESTASIFATSSRFTAVLVNSGCSRVNRDVT